MIERLVILGAMGDLTSRYLLPALAELRQVGRLPQRLDLVGVSREDWDTPRYRQHIREKLQEHARATGPEAREALVERLEYRQGDVTDGSAMQRALEPLDRPVAVYLALPPAIYAPTIAVLAALGLPEGSRIVVEKPFGEDLASARELNRLLSRYFPEQAIFRVDHFLGMHTVQNILGLRFANRIFEHLWNRDHIERVEVIWDETVALEGRAGYYDRAGALRDMIQNHLLQLLCLVGMEAPVTLDERDLRDRKVDVLRAIERLSPSQVERRTVRARYTAGRIGERAIPSYVEEPGIDPARGTETFAQVTLTIQNWRWSGVPFVLRTGKALNRDRREIVVHFRAVPHLAFEATSPPSNQLRLSLEPDCVTLSVNTTGHSERFELETAALNTELARAEVPTYGRVLLEVLAGQCTLAIRADEAEELWRVVEPILDVWQTGLVPLDEYPAGSDGPDRARSS